MQVCMYVTIEFILVINIVISTKQLRSMFQFFSHHFIARAIGQLY